MVRQKLVYPLRPELVEGRVDQVGVLGLVLEPQELLMTSYQTAQKEQPN